MHIVKLPGTSVGATVTDVDLSDLRDDEWESIEAAFLEHGMLVFPYTLVRSVFIYAVA